MLSQPIIDKDQLYTALASGAPFGIFEANSKGEFTVVNHIWCNIAGVPEKEALGIGWLDAVHPEDRNRVLSTWEEKSKMKHRFGMQLRFLHKIGRVNWATMTAIPLFNDDKSLAGFIGTLEDMTEFHVLEKINDQFFLISQDLMAVVGFDGYFKVINPSLQNILGYSAEEMKNKHFKDLIYPDDQLSSLMAFEEWLIKKKIDTFENRFKTKKGSYIWLSWNATVSDEDQVIYAIGRNVTEWKKMESELKKFNSVQRAILDSSIYMMISTDTKGIIQTFNRSAEINTGYRADEIIGKANVLILHDRSEIASRAQKLSHELGQTIEPGFDVFVAKAQLGMSRFSDESEWTYVRKDGTRFPILLSVTSIFSPHKDILGYLGVIRDVTEDKKLELMQNEFVSTVSHELRTP